ncbi:GNAT family N-acetyltransferase [Noviherbaspirillum cavernae]|uniref:GNAT family N-acetyltransferase n=1 Tax=Noviherbaspirillum cavernae TaxID=2320862 RepID=A0A418X0Y6_9BURK|nr:GNAT family N-acetyltransferase [Noviherbaspirillum cavernae]RJG06156.1 GNAT family N-acetyltransferase [Noviherbaspirillum cavernae]
MKYRLTLGDWASQKKDAQAIRYDVFVIEQHVPVELEWDDMDAACVHALAYDDQGAAVGTGRLLPDGHIGRMAVRSQARGSGIGGAILDALMQQARDRGDRAVMLNAQTHAAPFYRRYGFVQEGEEFMEAGIPHVQMRHDFE